VLRTDKALAHVDSKASICPVQKPLAKK
jgi:hypothetical protein